MISTFDVIKSNKNYMFKQKLLKPVVKILSLDTYAIKEVGNIRLCH